MFETVDNTLPRAGQIQQTIEQYAHFLENSWRQAPEAVWWPVIARHLQRPPVQPA